MMQAGGKQVNQNNPLLFYVLNMIRLVMLLMLCGVYYWMSRSEGTTAQQWFVLGAAAVFTVNHFLYFADSKWKGLNLTLNAVDFAAASAFGWVFLGESRLFFVFYGIIAVTLLLQTDNRRIIGVAVGATLLVWAAVLATDYAVTGHAEWIDALINFGFVAFSAVVGALIRYFQQARLQVANLYERLNESHEQLQEYARQVEGLTAIRERNHVAREIHDTVGHTMTALIVQLQAARKLQDRDPDKSRETLVRCEDLARSALQEVRLSVRALRDEEEAPASLTDSLRKMLAEFAAMTGMETELHVTGDASFVNGSLQPILYRVAQESLTNAQRHGRATKAMVGLTSSAECVELVIADNGEGAVQVVPGFGLVNMRERVAEQGGTVVFTSEKGAGFQVRVRFPLQAQTWRYGGVRA